MPGEEEARLSYLAVLSGLGTGEGRVVVFDTGGGSTEFIFGDGEEILDRFSLDVGSRQPTEEFCKSDPVTEAELAAMVADLEMRFARLKPGVDSLVGMGGTVTSMGAVHHKMKVYDPDVIQGSVLTLAEVERQVEMYRSQTIEERRETVGLMPKRADVILAGAAIVMTVMRKLGADRTDHQRPRAAARAVLRPLRERQEDDVLMRATNRLSGLTAQAALAVTLAVALVTAIAAMLIAPATARAAYPDRPISIIVHTKPGGAIDLTARVVAKVARNYTDVPLVIENRYGGSGAVAMRAVLGKRPDGYTCWLLQPPSSPRCRSPRATSAWTISTSWPA